MKVAIMLLFAFFLQYEAYSQSKYFEKKYKWEAIQLFRKVVLMEDEMIFAGNATAETINWKGMLCVTALNGDTLNTIEAGNPYGHAVFSDFKHINNLFLFTGNMTTPVGGESQQTLMFAWNKNNNQTSLYYIGSSDYNSVGRAITISLDNSVIIVGSSALQPYAVKTDTMGNIIWEQVYDTYPLLNWLTDIIPVPNEPAYYVIGTVGFNVFNGDILLAKISDATGEMLWDTTYNFGGVDGAGDIIRSQTGGYIIGGASEGLSNTLFKGAVFKVDNDFTIEWYNNQLFENCGCSSLKELPDGNIIVAACNDPNGAYAQMEIAKLRGSNGTIMWRRLYGGSWHDYAYDLALAPDGGFIVAGRQDTIIPGAPIGHASAWLLKLNCMGLLTQPAAAFSYEPQGANEVQFTNLSLYAYPDSTDGGYYIWDFGDGSPPYLCGQGYAPCTGSTLTHQYPAPGTYTATLTAIVCTDTSTVQAVIDTEGSGGTVGTSQNSPSRVLGRSGVVGVVVYPNPAQNTLQILVPPLFKELVPIAREGLGGILLQFYTLTGQLVLQTQLSPGEASKTISVAHLPAGVYVCKWQQAAGGASGYVKVAVVR